MFLDAYPNHVAGSFMVSITSTDNPVPSESTTRPQADSTKPAAVSESSPMSGDAGSTPEGSPTPNGSAD